MRTVPRSAGLHTRWGSRCGYAVSLVLQIRVQGLLHHQGSVAQLGRVKVQEARRLLQENYPNSRKVPLFSLFLFEKFLLLRPASPYKGRASHIAQLSFQTRDYPDEGPSWPNSPKQRPQSHWGHTVPMCLPLHPYLPPATSSNQVFPSAAQTLFGRGGSH